MSKATDRTLYESDFERVEGDRYWTAPWVTSALVDSVPFVDPVMGRVWEPACGRGDMVRVLLDHGFDVLASDADMSEFDPAECDCEGVDFLGPMYVPSRPVVGIVTNPPYQRITCENFVRRAVAYVEQGIATYVAVLLRSEWRHGRGRRDLFGDCAYYAGVLELTTRPRWDWWFRDQPEASPRHNYSWFLWHADAEQMPGAPREWFHYRDERSI